MGILAIYSSPSLFLFEMLMLIDIDPRILIPPYISESLQYLYPWLIASSTVEIYFWVKLHVVSFNMIDRSSRMVSLGVWRWMYRREEASFRYRVLSYSSSIATSAVSLMGWMLLVLLSRMSLSLAP